MHQACTAPWRRRSVLSLTAAAVFCSTVRTPLRLTRCEAVPPCSPSSDRRSQSESSPCVLPCVCVIHAPSCLRLASSFCGHACARLSTARSFDPP